MTWCDTRLAFDSLHFAARLLGKGVIKLGKEKGNRGKSEGPFHTQRARLNPG